jgi:DNA-binding NarL/FixJ family response regulator
MIGSRGNGRGLPHFLLKCSETAESVSGKPLLLDLLTTREREIAREVWRGGSNECIALRLGRDIGTIKKQLTAVYRKLGIRTRTELVRALGELEKSGAPSLS